MICRQCGENITNYQRFCPHCGSYFIAADDETDGRMWKGVITESGALSEDVVINEISSNPALHGSSKSTVIKARPVKEGTTKSNTKKVWGIIGFAAAAFTLICNIIYNFFPDSDIEFFGFFIFPLAVVGALLGFKSKFGKFAWLVIIAAIVTFIN